MFLFRFEVRILHYVIQTSTRKIRFRNTNFSVAQWNFRISIHILRYASSVEWQLNVENSQITFCTVRQYNTMIRN